MGPLRIELKDEDVLPLINKVIVRFPNKPELFRALVTCLRNLISISPDIPGMLHTVADIFHGHPDLIESFNSLLPSEFQVNQSPEQAEDVAQQQAGICTKNWLQQACVTPSPESYYCEKLDLLDSALNYINKVKDNCEASVFKDFIRVLEDFHGGEIDVPQTMRRIVQVLRMYPALIVSFNQFLPPGCEIHPDMAYARKRIEQRRRSIHFKPY